ncbi:FadR family transcriptional regulator [Mycolicibacterium flavescens]|uniref:GntR family transcriptional regulator n=1 Tax=Mycolicibacterium flavescens TaxID=1776 RepID=A0A1E3RDI3_MYCFV|nr:FCD domain-containing protein [Mycolicibacterium flavescens]MCV7282405.1 FadR family transcriptional regulator [Mycolicibacterium flavescens]ODQ87926.1 GntR family transcriptional regulator [Mycolicibacterium flavescens]
MTAPVRDQNPARKAAEVAAASLRRQIILGELREGESLPSEADLLAALRVSKPTLRQAIRILESESLVTVRRGPRGGIHVSVPTVETAAGYAATVLEYRGADTADLFEAAAALEGPCVAMLARSRSAEQVRRLRAAVAEESEALDDPQRLLSLENDFHRLIVECAGNATLRVLCEMIRTLIDTATSRYLSATRPAVHGPAFVAGSRTHRKVVDLIERGDAEAAEALWRKHIRETAARIGG